MGHYDLLHTVDISKGTIVDQTQIQQAINRTADLVKTIAKFAPEIGQAATMKDMLDQMKEYSAKTQNYYQQAAVVASNTQKANAMAAEVIELELKFNAKHTQEVNDIIVALGERMSGSQKLMVILLLVSIAISVVLIVAMTRSTINPIKKSVDGIKRITEGDLTANVEINTGDEFLMGLKIGRAHV